MLKESKSSYAEKVSLRCTEQKLSLCWNPGHSILQTDFNSHENSNSTEYLRKPITKVPIYHGMLTKKVSVQS